MHQSSNISRGLLWLGRLMACWLLASVVHAGKEGFLDATFSDDGKLLLEKRGLANLSGIGLPPLQQQDGKMVVAAYSDEGFLLARFTSEGLLDTAFGESGITRVFDVNVEQQSVRGFMQLHDGHLLLIGSADKVGGNPGTTFSVRRFTADGVVDDSFGDGGQVLTNIALSSAAWTAIEQQDGKLIVGGTACVEAEPATPAGQFVCRNAEFALARYLPDGSLDRGFGWKGFLILPLTRLKETVKSLWLQNDGYLLVLGSSGEDAAWARLAPNGALDTGFADGRGKDVLLDSVSGGSPMFIREDAAKKIVIAGTHVLPSRTAMLVQRYQSDGSLDKSFADKGSNFMALGSSSQLTAFTQMTNSDWLAAGEVCLRLKENRARGISLCVESDLVLARLNTNGVSDPDFGDEGFLVNSVVPARDIPLSMYELGDGDVLVTARSCQTTQCAHYDFSLVRYSMHLDGTDPAADKDKKRWWRLGL